MLVKLIPGRGRRRWWHHRWHPRWSWSPPWAWSDTRPRFSLIKQIFNVTLLKVRQFCNCRKSFFVCIWGTLEVPSKMPHDNAFTCPSFEPSLAKFQSYALTYILCTPSPQQMHIFCKIIIFKSYFWTTINM